jgi:hypothetical protein
VAQNRGTQAEFDLVNAQLKQQAERDFFEQSVGREKAGRDKDRNAWEMMNRANTMSQAPANLNRTMLSPYSRAQEGPNEFMREQASKYGNRSAVELDEGNTLPTPMRVGADVKMQDPGWFERWGGILGAGMTAADRARRT